MATALYEQYRPKRWDDVIGQDKAVRRAQAIASRGYGARAFWISGASGVDQRHDRPWERVGQTGPSVDETC